MSGSGTKSEAAAASARARRSRSKNSQLENLHGYRVDRENFIIHLAADPAHAGSSHLEPGEEPGVEHNMADRFEINLMHLSSIDRERNILVVLSSCGGNLDHALKIMGAMLDCPNPISILATYDATSATSLIPLVADHFSIRPTARYMLHLGSQTMVGIQQELMVSDIERRIALVRLLDLYVTRLKCCGRHKRWRYERIAQMLWERIEKKIDVWLSADQAVRDGFADSVFQGDWDALRIVKKDTVRCSLMRKVFRKEYVIPEVSLLDILLHKSH